MKLCWVNWGARRDELRLRYCMKLQQMPMQRLAKVVCEESKEMSAGVVAQREQMRQQRDRRWSTVLRPRPGSNAERVSKAR